MAARCIAFAAIALLSSPTLVAQKQETLLLQMPTISKEHVVFVYARDLWVVGRSGGEARRLTSSDGDEFFPQLSPDGRWVAFSGEYDGNTDVYVMPTAGGTPKRLTWHPGTDYVRDWHPDGKRLLIASDRASQVRAHQLWHVSIEGGTPKPLPIPRAWHAKYGHGGKRIAYTPWYDAFRSWKRYRGGRVSRIWLYDPETHEVDEVPHVNASDSYPSWAGEWVYFVSDRDNRMNLWRYRPSSRSLEQLTRFKNFDVRSLDAMDDAVVFEQGGALHLHDVKTNSTKTLSIQVRTDGLHRMPRWESAKGHVRSASIAPNGKRAVFEARGEIVTVPKERGPRRNLSNSPGAHDRSPSWSPDGKQICWFSDASGEYQLHVRNLETRKTKHFELTPRREEEEAGGFYYAPAWSPDSKHVLFRDKTNRLAFVSVADGKVTEVSRSMGSLGVLGAAAAWSPDSAWIAFEKRNPSTAYDSVWLFEVASGKRVQVTDGFAVAGSPCFSSDGKYLFFEASVDAGPQRFGLDMSAGAVRPAGNYLYCCVLKKDAKNPLAPRSDEGWSPKKPKADAKKDKKSDGEKKDGEKKDGKKKDEEKKADAGEGAAKAEGDKVAKAGAEKGDAKANKEDKKPSIDLDDLDQRIIALPLGRGRYYNLRSAGSKLLFINFPTSGAPELKSFDFATRKAKTIAPGVRGFDVSADGKSLLLSRGGSFAIANAAGQGAKPLAIDSVQLRVDPSKEWPQILREVWRIQRDYFYDREMHGVDWTAMWERWRRFLPHVQHRTDLNVLISELIGELACGHQYVRGGEIPDKPAGVNVGLLGCDWNEDKGRFRIAKIYRGQNWNPGLRAPLTSPGVVAKVGEYLISVDGRPVTTKDNLYSFFEQSSGRHVEVELASKPDGSDARKVQVVPVSSERNLRQRSWVETNRKRVDELSNGRLAYVYMPNTGNQGMAAFDRDFYSQIDKEGLVLDERYNGGGKVADYVIDVLSRDVRCFWMNREQWLGRTPFGTMDGPKVMIVNEMAGSGGDCMPWMFQQAKLGPVVGNRTWGGLVGISGYPPLMDGGSVTAASFGIMDTNGEWVVENVGVTPDVTVIEFPKPIIEGGDPQLEKAVELALAELEKHKKRKLPKYHPPSKR